MHKIGDALKKAFIKEEKRTAYEAAHGEHKKFLSKQEVLIVVAASLVSAFISVFVKFSYVLRFAHFENNAVMATWNPYAAPIKIFGLILFLYCCNTQCSWDFYLLCHFRLFEDQWKICLVSLSDHCHCFHCCCRHFDWVCHRYCWNHRYYDFLRWYFVVRVRLLLL